MIKIANWDRDWLELMYNNRERVSDSEIYIEKWKKKSENFRKTVKNQSIIDIPYGKTPQETLDIFMPKIKLEGNNPVLVFIHGGYWQALSKDDFSFIAEPFINKGAFVVIVNYTLCPFIKVSGIVDEITRALIWINRHIKEYGADPNKITLSGHSVGGHLTAMMFTHNWETLLPELNGKSPFKNGLSLSGLYDLAPLQHVPFLESLHLDNNEIINLSPANLSCLASNVSLYSLVGENESEEFHRQNALIQSSFGEKVVPICMSIPALNHFSIVDAFADPTHQIHSLALKQLGL